MKTELQAKFLHHLLSKKKGDEGFTLIELLVVIIIIGILAAIALPSFLNQANKARESEAKTYVGSMNRGQQAYYLEDGSFGTLAQIGIGIPTSTGYYKYDTTTGALSTAAKTKGAVRDFSGIVTVASGTSTAKICENTLTCS
ncbi:MAG: prepilin-type N-terminal cleavage/methylation domain-containing protein [Leptolyngbyaceae cyanobacterium CSU_1_4]|nr:prepilin-type N-terminal cleavage/methylation domain-containing protein [Leptolyngbyaceae cyanobacterium CSU_1_4]